MHKTAVCFSGQLRTWRHCVPFIKAFFEQPGVEVDYFIHAWDYNSVKFKGIYEPTSLISQAEWSEVIDVYRPKGFVLDSKEARAGLIKEYNWSSLFYSFMRSIRLKREHELARGFKYDVVVKVRPDMVYHPDFQFKDHYPEQLVAYFDWYNRFRWEFNLLNLNDITFYGSSFTMDVISNIFYEYLSRLKREVDFNEPYMGPGPMIQSFINRHNIDYKQARCHMSNVILRETAVAELEEKRLPLTFDIAHNHHGMFYEEYYKQVRVDTNSL